MRSNKASDDWPRGLGAAIAFWGCFLAVVTGLFLAALTEIEVRDANIRSDLAHRGVYATAKFSGYRCERRKRSLKVDFVDANGKQQSKCILDIYEGLQSQEDLYGADVGVIYDPIDPSYVYLAPDGRLPQHSVQGIWMRWLRHTMLVLAVSWAVTAVALWRKRRTKSA